MRARLAVLADAANITAEGKLNILGEFNVIVAARTPSKWTRMFLVLKLDADIGEIGKHLFRIRTIDPDGKPIAQDITGEIEFTPPRYEGIPGSGPLIFEIRDAVFPTYGGYEFEIHVGGSKIQTVPLYVVPRPAAK
jgi:hypothetical protein